MGALPARSAPPIRGSHFTGAWAAGQWEARLEAGWGGGRLYGKGAVMAAAVALWVRTEPPLLGALPLPPPARLGRPYLRKMAAYARRRAAEGCFPRLRWASWRHIACGKLRLGRGLAWLYFQRFLRLLPAPPPRSLRRAEAEAACGSAEELERERSKARPGWGWGSGSVCVVSLCRVPVSWRCLSPRSSLWTRCSSCSSSTCSSSAACPCARRSVASSGPAPQPPARRGKEPGRAR